MKKSLLMAVASTILSTSAFAAIAQPLSTEQTQQIEGVIQSYFQKNPGVVMQALEAAMAAQQVEELAKLQKAVGANKDKLFSDKRSPTTGNAKASQTVVVFMDPYCGYCRKFHAEIDKVLATNKDLKVVFKDIAIMSEKSDIAIKAMKAAHNQGKYKEMQGILMSSAKLTEETLVAKAKELGLDVKKFTTDLHSKETQALVDDTKKLSSDMGVNGTPTLVIGDKVHPGYLSAEDLTTLLKETKKAN